MGREFGENGYMYVYVWVALLSTWNYYTIVNRLYSNIKQKVKEYGADTIEVKLYFTDNEDWPVGQHVL